jgi:hypothetical protein
VACSLHAGCCCSWWAHCAWHALTVVGYVDSGRPLGMQVLGMHQRPFKVAVRSLLGGAVAACGTGWA